MIQAPDLSTTKFQVGILESFSIVFDCTDNIENCKIARVNAS